MKPTPEEFARGQRRLHGPDWRRQRAEAAAAAGLAAPAGPADPQVADLCAYLRLRRQGPGAAERADAALPRVAAALALAADPAARRQAQALALGGCAPEEAAARLGVGADALAAWEALCFDVRPARASADWVVARVIEPERERGDPQLAALLTFAYAGGPVAARAALDAEARVRLGEGQALLDLRVRLHLKFAEATDRPLRTEREKLAFVKLHADLLYREQRLRLAERRLEQRCAEALRQQRAEDARLERRRRKAEERAAREAERARRRAGRRMSPAARRRAGASAARREAGRRRGAASALNQLRWEFSGPSPAAAAPPGPGGAARGGDGAPRRRVA